MRSLAGFSPPNRLFGPLDGAGFGPLDSAGAGGFALIGAVAAGAGVFAGADGDVTGGAALEAGGGFAAAPNFAGGGFAGDAVGVVPVPLAELFGGGWDGVAAGGESAGEFSVKSTSITVETSTSSPFITVG